MSIIIIDICPKTNLLSVSQNLSKKEAAVRAEKSTIYAKMEEFGKDMELSHIMKDMEQLYGIPGTEDEEWNEKHPDVVFIYDRIRKMRSF